MNLCPKSSIAGIVAGLILFVLAPSRPRSPPTNGTCPPAIPPKTM